MYFPEATMTRKDDDLRRDDADLPRDSNDAPLPPLPAPESLEGLDEQPTSAMGGVGGAAFGAAVGAPGGPIGVAIGAIAGAVGGWWTGHAIHASREFQHHDARFRHHHESLGEQGVDYEKARPAYQLGHLASRNPEYASRSFDEIEEHVRLGWTPEIARKHGDWQEVRRYAQAAYIIGQDKSEQLLDREVPLTRAADRVEADRSMGDAAPAATTDPGASVAASSEEGEAVYPTEIDALANGIPAEPGSEAAREFGISDAEATRESARDSGRGTIVDPREDETRIGEELRADEDANRNDI
jgi:hypothetical protein